MSRPTRSVPTASRMTLAVTAVAAVALVVLAASGGAFDLVTRQSAAVLAWWDAAILALVVRRGGLTPGISGIAVTLFGTAIPIWISLNLGHSLSTERTATELARGVAHLAPIVLIGWLMPARHWRAVIAGAAIGGVAIVAAGFADRLSPGLFTTTPTVVFENTSDRLATPLGYWNAVGSWSVITLLLVLAIASHDGRALVRAAALAAAPMAVGVAYMTYSRSAIVSAAVALAVLLVLSRNRWTLAAHTATVAIAGGAVILAIRSAPHIATATGSRGAGGVLFLTLLATAGAGTMGYVTARFRLDRKRMEPRTGRIAGIAATALVIAALGGLAAAKGGELKDKFTSVNVTQTGAGRLTDVGNGPRVEQWRAAIETWKANKAHGTGAGTFEIDWNRSPRADSSFVRDAHSAFLESLAEQGTIGLLVLIGFVASAIGAVLAARRSVDRTRDVGLVAGAAAGIAAFLVGSGFDWFWEVTALAAFALVLLGALIAADREHAEGSRPRRRPVPWRIALAAVAVVGALVQVPGLVGTSEVRKSQRDVSAGDLGAARAHADQAIDTMPWASSPFFQRALVDEQAGAFDASRRALKLAIERDPYDWRFPLVLARVEAKSGRVDAALAAFEQARKLRPHGQFFRAPVRTSDGGA